MTCKHEWKEIYRERKGLIFKVLLIIYRCDKCNDTYKTEHDI